MELAGLLQRMLEDAPVTCIHVEGIEADPSSDEFARAGRVVRLLFERRQAVNR